MWSSGQDESPICYMLAVARMCNTGHQLNKVWLKETHTHLNGRLLTVVHDKFNPICASILAWFIFNLPYIENITIVIRLPNFIIIGWWYIQIPRNMLIAVTMFARYKNGKLWVSDSTNKVYHTKTFHISMCHSQLLRWMHILNTCRTTENQKLDWCYTSPAWRYEC